MTSDELAAAAEAGLLLRPQEVAAVLGITRGRVARRGDWGLITFIRTPRGHRRYHAASVRNYLTNLEMETSECSD